MKAGEAKANPGYCASFLGPELADGAKLTGKLEGFGRGRRLLGAAVGGDSVRIRERAAATREAPAGMPGAPLRQRLMLRASLP